MTLRISANGKGYDLGPAAETLTTSDKITVSWSGDGSNRAIVSDHNGLEIGRFEMPVKGFATEVKYSVHVAPIEVGEPTTEVKRSIGLERI